MDDTSEHPFNRWPPFLWLLIGLLTPLFVNFWVEQQFEASKIWLFRTLVWLLGALWISGWLKGRQQRMLSPSLRKLLLGLALVLLLSTLLSTHRTIAVFGTLDRANGVLTQLSYLLLFLCTATQISPKQSRQLLKVVCLTAVPICLIGLAQAAGWQPFPVITDARTSLTTTLGRANFTGAYLALLLPLTLMAATSAAIRWQRWGYAALAILELCVIFLTQARAAWIATAVGLGLLLWLRFAPRWSSRARWLTLLCGLGGLSVFLVIILRLGNAAGGSIAARSTIWQASLRLLWPRLWLGYGADTLELHFPSVYPPQLVYYQGRGIAVDRAHNWLLDWSLNYGVVATILFIGLIAFIVWRSWPLLTASQTAEFVPNGEQPLGTNWLAACLAALGAHLVGNLFLFDVAATAVLFWLLLAIVAAASDSQETLTLQLQLPSWARNLSTAAGLLILGGAIWLSNLSPLLADANSWQGTQKLQQNDPNAALAKFETAVDLQPNRAAYHVAAALTAAQLGNFPRAEAAMLKAIALRPGDPVLYTQLAGIYGQKGQANQVGKEAAYAAYEQAIALAPTIALTHQQYADLALRLGDWPTALAQANQAVNLDATDGISFGILGWVYLQNGNLTEAQKAFEQAVRWQPNSADFHLGLATVFFQKGNIADSQQSLRHSLSLNPTYGPALTLQSQLAEK